MSATIINPDYNWKQAATQEGVDYDAVMKSFMDQSYGVVANKAKVLFQDPYRLGFEIVHRNEKATKMVGIFAFRCNKSLLYAPVFFVNGEIKSADMLYRADVKRFVPLTDEWCAFLVRGANKASGDLVDKGRHRQADAYMDRLAYPQRVKYASAEGVALFKEILAHCADDSDSGSLIPRLIREEGPQAIEKLASLIENSEIAKRFVVENYTAEELQDVSGWQEKRAAAPDPELNSIVFVSNPELAKSAAERDCVMDHGYCLVDNRPKEATNTVIEELKNNSLEELGSPGVADVLMSDGSSEKMVLLTRGFSLGSESCCSVGGPTKTKAAYAYNLGKKQILELRGMPLFGDECIDQSIESALVKPEDLSAGNTYAAVDVATMSSSEPHFLQDYKRDGESAVLTFVTEWGSKLTVFYAPGRESNGGKFISDGVRFLKVDADVERDDERVSRIECKWDVVPMDSTGIDKWLRTAGGLAQSTDLTVTKKVNGTFDIEHKDGSGVTKVARDLGMLEAHIKLATDFELTCDTAGNILSKTIDEGVTRHRVFDTVEKSAFSTKMDSMHPWIQSFDPELNVRIDTPQRQVISTHTPQRQQQQSRYGDHWDRGHLGARDPEEDGLPEDALFSKSPEELATMANAYNMPHIFDHGALQQMATSMFNTVTQIQQYIPDLETGVDRYFRILFLLRYRPADFEEAYGKDAILEMEQELGELATMSGDNLLRMIKRFDINKYSSQE